MTGSPRLEIDRAKLTVAKARRRWAQQEDARRHGRSRHAGLGTDGTDGRLPLHDESQRGGAWFAAMAWLAGALVGLVALTRYSFAWLILPVLAFFAMHFGKRRILLCPVALLARAQRETSFRGRRGCVTLHRFPRGIRKTR